MDAQEDDRQEEFEIRRWLDKRFSALHIELDCMRLELLSIIHSEEVRPKAQVLTGSQNRLSCDSEARYFAVWTQQGENWGTRRQYEDKYAKPPVSWGPRIWVDLIAGDYSVLVERKRRSVRLNGKRLELLCLFLRRFNELISKNELEEEIPYYTQVLNQLHKSTYGVLKPFIDVQSGQGQRLMPHAMNNRRVKLTFCLIDCYKTSGRDNQ